MHKLKNIYQKSGNDISSDEKTILILVYLIDHINSNEKEQILAKLEEIHSLFPSNSRPLLHEIIHEKEFKFYPKRAIAANIIGRLNNRKAIPQLSAILQNPEENELVRGACAEALAELHAKSLSPVFKLILENKREPNRVRAACAIALGWIFDKSAVKLLLDTIDDENRTVWMAAVDSLHNFTSLSINFELFQKFISLPRGTKKASCIREILLTRDILPLITKVSEKNLIQLLDIFSQRKGKYLYPLYHYLDNLGDSQRKELISNFLLAHHPKISFSEDHKIML